MASSTELDTTTILLVILGIVIVLPVLTMGLGVGGMMRSGSMMDGYGMTDSWWPLVGLLVQLIIIVALLGGGYLVFRRLMESRSSHNPAMEELRIAYARGDLTDEEFEARREKLKRSE